MAADAGNAQPQKNSQIMWVRMAINFYFCHFSFILNEFATFNESVLKRKSRELNGRKNKK